MMDDSALRIMRGTALGTGSGAGTAALHKPDGASGPQGAPGSRAAASVQEATPVQTQAALREVNASLRAVGLEFQLDQDTDKMVAKVIDRETGEVIRQMPSEEVIHIARVLEKMQGVLIRQSA